MKGSAGTGRKSLLKVAQRRAEKPFHYLLLKVPPFSKHALPKYSLRHVRNTPTGTYHVPVGHTRLDFLIFFNFLFFNSHKDHDMHLNTLECVYFLTVYLHKF